jgi:uncharacterized protein (TIGR03435 family)
VTGVIVTLVIAAVTAQSPIEFDAASLKRNIGAQSQFGSPSILPTGEIRLINVPLRFLVSQAYPGATVPVKIEKLPSWAEDTYDFVAKGKPNASPDERAQMFRSLMAQRSRLTAHLETRPQPGYRLLIARLDGRLGPSLTRSTLDCSTRNARPSAGSDRGIVEEAARSRCGLFDSNHTMSSGGVTITQLARSISAWVGQPITDDTGLTGLFALTFTFQHRGPRPGELADANDPPSVFTAIQEQLGLKLVPATVATRVLVIDHIERPSDN